MFCLFTAEPAGSEPADLMGSTEEEEERSSRRRKRRPLRLHMPVSPSGAGEGAGPQQGQRAELVEVVQSGGSGSDSV